VDRLFKTHKRDQGSTLAIRSAIKDTWSFGASRCGLTMETAMTSMDACRSEALEGCSRWRYEKM
jgi:hypothetical protein